MNDAEKAITKELKTNLICTFFNGQNFIVANHITSNANIMKRGVLEEKPSPLKIYKGTKRHSGGRNNNIVIPK